MSAVLVGIVARYGLQGVFLACFTAGALLLAAGLLRLGKLISFIPMPVIMGFTLSLIHISPPPLAPSAPRTPRPKPWPTRAFPPTA